MDERPHAASPELVGVMDAAARFVGLPPPVSADLTPAQALRRWEALVAVQGPTAGLENGRDFARPTRSVISLAVAAAPSPLVGFQVVARALPQHLGVPTFQLQEHPETITLLPPALDGSLAAAVATDHMMAWAIEAVRFSLGEHSGVRVLLPTSYATREAWEGSVIVVGSAGVPQVAFPRALLERPSRTAGHDTFQLALLALQRPATLSALSLGAQVRGVLDRTPHLDRVSLADVAEALGMPPRTLQRRLSAEGLSFRHLLDALRMKRARTLLLQGQPIETVALQAGFSERRAFERAFRRMEGLTPAQWRAQHQGADR